MIGLDHMMTHTMRLYTFVNVRDFITVYALVAVPLMSLGVLNHCCNVANQ